MLGTHNRVDPMSGTTVDQLRDAVRVATGIADLDWATPPLRLSGGFWAEMYEVQLGHLPAGMTGRLVARIMPDADTAARETAVQRYVGSLGVAVPTIRLSSGPTPQLDRAWMLMDHAAGQPLLGGLTAVSAIRQAPMLYRRLPDVLAEASAAVHRCSVTGLEGDLRQQLDVAAFLARLADQAQRIDRPDLARVAARLTDRAPAGTTICHGDLHPFNVLVSADAWTILDWSTAVVADPHYDLGFTTLMLSNPPLGGPRPVRALARAVGNRLSQRFLQAYARASGFQVDPVRLDWAHSVHALRALTELANWEAHGTAEAHRGHPWTALRPVFETQLQHP